MSMSDEPAGVDPFDEIVLDEDFVAGVDKIRATLETRLTEAGRFVGEPNRLYARVAAAGYGTLAKRLGITPNAAASAPGK